MNNLKKLFMAFLISNAMILLAHGESGERVTTEDPVIKNDLFYLPNEDKPFTGRYETYYPNGNKKGVAHIKDGKFDGLMTLWDETGQNKSEKIIKNGVEMPVTEEQKLKKSVGEGFSSFRTEAETVRNSLGCPKSVDADTVNGGSLYGGDLYGCILGAMQTVKWFINENSNKEVHNVKFLWNDWFKDVGFGVHSDKEEAQKALKVLIKLYAPEKSKEVDSAFFGNTSKTITSAKFVLEYTYDRGPAIDERMIVVTER
ncbi:MAG: toxin-antitoxin system YwqK family antitoxin [Methylovulum sp.]